MTAPSLDIGRLQEAWRDFFKIPGSPPERIGLALVKQFLGGVRMEDESAWQGLRGRPALFLGNHQTFVESFLLAAVLPPLLGKPVVFLAKVGHQEQWLGRLTDFLSRYPGIQFPRQVFEFVDRENAQDFLRVAKNLERVLKEEGESVLVHVEGRRAREEGARIQKISSIWLDLCRKCDCPIVPFWLAGGLPERDLGRKFDFPYLNRKQDLRLGTPIFRADLESLPLVHQIEKVKGAINRLAELPPVDQEIPHSLNEISERWLARTGAGLPQTVIYWTAVENLARSDRGREDPLNTFLGAGKIFLEGEGPVAVDYPDTAEGRWFCEFSRWLWGERGPVPRCQNLV